MLRGKTFFYLACTLPLLMAACAKKDPAPIERPASPVTVVSAVAEDVPFYLDEVGHTVSREVVSVQPQVSGKITEMLFADGADLKKGDPLFTIDPRPFQAQLDAAQANLAQSKAALDYARIEFDRVKDLVESRAIARQDYDTRKNAVDVGEAQVKQNEAAVESARLNMEYTSIRSPIDGRAGHRLVDLGNVVTANMTTLLTIERMDPIYADFTVTEGDFSEVQRNEAKHTLRVEVRLPDEPDKPEIGQLTFLDNSVQSSQRNSDAPRDRPEPRAAPVAGPVRECAAGAGDPAESRACARRRAAGFGEGALRVRRETRFNGGTEAGETRTKAGRSGGGPARTATGRTHCVERPAWRNTGREGARGSRPRRTCSAGSGAIMNLSEPFIRRPVMTAVLTVSVIVFGVLGYLRLPVNDLPVVDYPVISVQANYPGASPDTVANNIATPLERQFMQINGLELVTSQSTQGHVSFTLQFALDKSIDAAATDVQTAISQATGSLPTDLPSPPTYTKTNPNDQPILYIALTSDSVTPGQLYDYGSTQVGERISILPGVSSVNVFGTKSAVRIKVDPSKMWARGISIDDLVTAVKNGTSYTGAGQFDSPAGTALLQPNGQLDTAAVLRKFDRQQHERRAGVSARRGGRGKHGAGRADQDEVLGARVPGAGRNGRSSR